MKMHLRTHAMSPNEWAHNENNLITEYFFSGRFCVSVRLDIFVIERFSNKK